MSNTLPAADLSFFDGIVERIADLKTQFDVVRFMRRVTEFYGARTFLVLTIPSTTSRSFAGDLIVSNWPADLVGLMEKEGWFQKSTALQRLRGSTLAFTFDNDMWLQDQFRTEVREVLMRVGMARGGCFPCHDISGSRGAVMIAGLGPLFSQQQMMELNYIAAHVFERLAQIRVLDVKPNDLLTDREVDCLNWTAAGKTSAEIAEILGLSEHTVNHYLNRAAKKLDTVNRTQAVAKALRIGLIK
ncbi:MAG: LuxR C-terminal-related transcriptional regulator [Neorhizobium sp.]|jgi:DNA-binding CsgD family transcriptional regulator|nr:LuxR C-terminal-related transcriptional regulator [Neorhizobium sp.]